MAANKPITPGTIFGQLTVLSGPEIVRYKSGLGNSYFYECLCFCGSRFKTTGKTGRYLDGRRLIFRHFPDSSVGRATDC